MREKEERDKMASCRREQALPVIPDLFNDNTFGILIPLAANDIFAPFYFCYFSFHFK